MKDTSQSQSRLPQWTHPNSMDNLSSAASSLDQNSSKHGNVPWQPLPFGDPSHKAIGIISLMFLSCVNAHKWLVRAPLSPSDFIDDSCSEGLAAVTPCMQCRNVFSFIEFCCWGHAVQVKQAFSVGKTNPTIFPLFQTCIPSIQKNFTLAFSHNFSSTFP